MSRLEGPWLPRPAGVETIEVCAETGRLPGEGCGRRIAELFPEGRGPASACVPRREAFRLETPQAWDRYFLDPSAPASARFLVFRAHAPEGAEVEWRVDGRLLEVTLGPHELRWPASPGAHELRVLCGGGAIARPFHVR